MTYVIHNEVANYLDPQETNIRIQGFLQETKYIQEKNYIDEYVFSFFPCTPQDYHRLYEHIESFLVDVETGFGPYSNVTAKAKYELKDGSSQCSQLFKPKLNCEPPCNEWLHQKEASLNLYLRNGPDGTIYLQCSYVDIMDPYLGIEPKQFGPEEFDPNADYDF